MKYLMIINQVTAAINNEFGDELPTIEQINDKAATFRKIFSSLYPISDMEFIRVKKELAANILHSIGFATTLRGHDAEHQSWYFIQENYGYYWNRYKTYLKTVKHWGIDIVNRLNKTTDEIMDDLGNPKDSKRPFQRRGLLLGDVQSGKTATYTAVCNKASDAGYRVIIVLAGMMENLRFQTQERLDAEFVGKESKYTLDKKAEQEIRNRPVGVGKIPPYSPEKSIACFTSVATDFNKAILHAFNLNLRTLNGTALFVVKKNKSVLNNLYKWLLENNADHETGLIDLPLNLGGCFIDLMSGEYIINVLEPKTWDDGSNTDEDVPQAFKCKTKLSQHISFLRDFFRSYKDFTDREIDTIELLLIKLYDNFGISDDTDWSALKPADYPILSDFYALIEAEYQGYNPKQKNLYTAETLQNICLGLHSLCKGAESKFFDGHTNITDDNFITFGVKGLLQASKNIRNALLFNVLSYMSEQLLTKGNTVASVDEFYLFLTNLTAVEYIRNFIKRVRKKESAVILASQNIEDFLTENVRELTKLLFAIPTHQFLFNAGTVDSTFYMDALQLEPSEYKIIQYPHRGMCLYKCGNERYCLCVTAPQYKAELFGKAGGR